MINSQPYRTIVADPPWTPTMSVINGGSRQSGSSPKGSPQYRYNTLSLEEIINLRPTFSSQAHLYIWCLAQHIDWAYNVARAWGADPLIVWTWKKPGLGVGRFQCNTEHILLSRVGNPNGNPFGSGGRYVPATNGTLFEWPRGKHSEKPGAFFDLVERLSPPPRLEMFARTTRLGWHSWGNEVPQALPAACIEYCAGSSLGQGSPTAWRCKLCNGYGFDGAESVKHKIDCAIVNR